MVFMNYYDAIFASIQEAIVANFFIDDALTFVHVIDEGSFAAAAKKCSVSASVVSKRISRLESHLRVQLLQRTTRTILITEIGQVFYDRCKKIKSEINEAAIDLFHTHERPSGLLRINAPMSFGQVHLVPAVNDFLKQYPDITIELILGSQYSSFINNGLDLAIFIKDLPDTFLLKSRKIALRSTGVYGSPDYFSRFPIPKIPHDLEKHNCLIYQSEPGYHVGSGQKYEWNFTRDHKHYSIPINGNLRMNSSQALVKSAIAGIGLIKLSSFMVTEEIKKGKLIGVLQDYCPQDIDIHAAYPSQRYLPFKIKLFIDFLVERFNSTHYWDKNFLRKK